MIFTFSQISVMLYTKNRAIGVYMHQYLQKAVWGLIAPLLITQLYASEQAHMKQSCEEKAAAVYHLKPETIHTAVPRFLYGRYSVYGKSPKNTEEALFFVCHYDKNGKFMTLNVETDKRPHALQQTEKMQQLVEHTVKQYSHDMNDTAIRLLVKKNGHTYKAAAGLADREHNRSVKVDDLFEIGSATKVFTGIAIFQLIESGKLSLETKLSTFYPKGEITQLANYQGQNYWNEVTVGMLLRHTSGFIDYLNVYNDDAKALKILGGKEKHFTFDALIHQAVTFGDANFKPGAAFKYCNTGYIILGEIISKVSGMDWRDYIQKHILDRAGMKHTYFGSRIPKSLREHMPKGYMHFKEVFMAPSLAGSAGEIISTLDDLATLMHAWGSGRLYDDPHTLAFQLEKGFQLQAADQISNLYYGYAIMKLEGFYGHGGQTFGFQSYMATKPQTGETYIVSTNDSTVSSMNLFMGIAGIDLKRVPPKKP